MTPNNRFLALATVALLSVPAARATLATAATFDEKVEKVVAPVPSTVVKIDNQRGMAVPAEVPRTLRQFETDVNESVRNSRQHHTQMQMIEAKRQRQASAGSLSLRYKLVIAIAA